LKSIFAVVFGLVAGLTFGETGATVLVIPVEGFPQGNEVVSYSILRAEAQNTLVLESIGAGILQFHTLHLVDGVLMARVADSSSLPGEFVEPGTAVPQTRTFADLPDVDRHWEVLGSSPFANEQYVTAVPLVERRFADVSMLDFPETPPTGAGLAIDFVVSDVTGTVMSRCRLEPNLVRRGERMTVVEARWVPAQGRPHLLLAMSTDSGDGAWPLFFRLYSPELELVAQTPVTLQIDPNRLPVSVLSDLTGDGQDEVIFFPTAAGGPPVAVLELGPALPTGGRDLGLNDCSTRMNGPDVVRIQESLARRGYSLGPYGIDGWYGPDTRAAVVRYQRDAGLPVTGVVDEQTRSSLGYE